MNAESVARIDAILQTEVSELFALHGTALSRSGEAGLELAEPFAATIGFTSEKVIGALVITSGRKLLERSLPASLRTRGVTEDIIADWTGELSNQVLGRLKARFIGFGVEIALSTPTVFAGTGLRHYPRAYPLSMTLGFAEGLLVELQAAISGELELGEERPVEEGPPEGEALFF